LVGRICAGRRVGGTHQLRLTARAEKKNKAIYENFIFHCDLFLAFYFKRQNIDLYRKIEVFRTLI
jgi:hypothetical protein